MAGTNDGAPENVTRMTSEFVPPGASAAPDAKDASVEVPLVSQAPGTTVAGTPAPRSGSGSGVGSGSGSFVSLGPGSVLGPWTLERELGRGGMGIVFAAKSPTGAQVALKVLRDPSRGRLVQRFVRETHALGRLDHPNIVRLLDYGEEGAQPYYVMDFVAGKTFEAALAEGGLSLQKKIKILSDVARGVAHAHGHAVVHRDLKPQNVILDDAGVPKITDFGLARILDEGDGQGKVTISGAALGTPAYMSPEQFRGRRIDARTDVYALGVMLFECVEGRLPFDTAQDLHQLGIDVVEKPPPVPATDDKLTSVILRALEKDPANRHPTALELARDLEAWLGGDRAGPPSRKAARSASGRFAPAPAPRVKPPEPSSNGAVVAFVVGILLLVAVVAAAVLKRRPAPTPAPPPATGLEAPAPPAPLPPPGTPADPPVPALPNPIGKGEPMPELDDSAWIETGTELGFRVRMPGAPTLTHDTLAVIAPKGGHTLHLKRGTERLDLPGKNRSYIASAVTLPPGFKDAQEPLVMVAKGVADELGCKNSELNLLPGALVAGELSGAVRDGLGKAHAVFYVMGLNVYALIIISGGDVDADAQRFVASFKLGTGR